MENRVLLLLEIGRAGQASDEGRSALLYAFHQDVDPAVKQAAIWSLGRAGQGTPEVVIALLGALQDSDKRIRYTSIVSLSTLGLKSSQVVEALLVTLQDSDARLRQEAVRSLGKLGQTLPEVVPALYDLLHPMSMYSMGYGSWLLVVILRPNSIDGFSCVVYSILAIFATQPLMWTAMLHGALRLLQVSGREITDFSHKGHDPF